MVNHVRVALVIAGAFVAGTLVPAVSTQGPIPGTGEYVVVNYMKVPAGKGPEYVALERDTWKAVHQARVRDGKMKSWSLWQKRFGGSEDGYAFMTVNTYNKFGDIEGGLQDYLQKANPGKNVVDIQSQTQAAREIARTEVWSVIDQTK
jgi:hypothetical protein